MNEEEFRFKDTRSDPFKRHLEILKGNYAVFLRRSIDASFGTPEDQAQARRQLLETELEISNLERASRGE